MSILVQPGIDTEGLELQKELMKS